MIKEQIRVRVCVCVLLEKISETSSRQCKQCEEWKGFLWRWDYYYEKILTILCPSICTKGQLKITLSRQSAMLTPPTPPPHKVWSSKICTHKNVFLLNDIENSHRFQYACTFAVVTETVREKSIYRCIFFLLLGCACQHFAPLGCPVSHLLIIDRCANGSELCTK